MIVKDEFPVVDTGCSTTYGHEGVDSGSGVAMRVVIINLRGK